MTYEHHISTDRHNSIELERLSYETSCGATAGNIIAKAFEISRRFNLIPESYILTPVNLTTYMHTPMTQNTDHYMYNYVNVSTTLSNLGARKLKEPHMHTNLLHEPHMCVIGDGNIVGVVDMSVEMTLLVCADISHKLLYEFVRGYLTTSTTQHPIALGMSNDIIYPFPRRVNYHVIPDTSYTAQMIFGGTHVMKILTNDSGTYDSDRLQSHLKHVAVCLPEALPISGCNIVTVDDDVSGISMTYEYLLMVCSIIAGNELNGIEIMEDVLAMPFNCLFQYLTLKDRFPSEQNDYSFYDIRRPLRIEDTLMDILDPVSTTSADTLIYTETYKPLHEVLSNYIVDQYQTDPTTINAIELLSTLLGNSSDGLEVLTNTVYVNSTVGKMFTDIVYA